MINSARAETDARSARGVDGIAGESNSDFGDDREGEKMGVSSDVDAEADVSGYDDVDDLEVRRGRGRKRDSI